MLANADANKSRVPSQRVLSHADLTLLRLSQGAQALAPPSHLVMLASRGIRPSMESPLSLVFQPRDRFDMPVYTVETRVES